MALPLRWSPRAARQLEDLCAYIAKDSAYYAQTFAQRILQTIRSIPANPKLGRMVPEYGNAALRERNYQGYRIVYRLKNGIIEIVAICHGARRLESALEEKE